MNDDKVSIGTMRFLKEKRQLAGLLMITGFCALIQPLVGVSSTINGMGPGTTPTSGLPLSSLIGGLCTIVIGMLSVAIGYMELVHDFGYKHLTGFAMLWTQTAWIVYISAMTGIGRGARTGAMFGAEAYDAAPGDGNFIAAMGILGVISYGLTLIGSVAFLLFALYAFQKGLPTHRDGKYYKSRSKFYSINLFIAGISQFLLAAFVLAKYGSNLTDGPIAVAMYLIRYPALNLIVGLVLIFNAVWGFLRSHDMFVGGPEDRSYQYSLGIQWVIQLTFQVFVSGFSMPAAFAGFAPTVTAFSFALSLMSGFLDFKARTVAETMSPEYFGMTAEGSNEKDDTNEEDNV